LCGGIPQYVAASILKQRGWDNFLDVRGGFKEIAETKVPKTEYVCPSTLL
jgi:hydroxyacylglutathione hydrolase